jgi:hypothetical protein
MKKAKSLYDVKDRAYFTDPGKKPAYFNKSTRQEQMPVAPNLDDDDSDDLSMTKALQKSSSTRRATRLVASLTPKSAAKKSVMGLPPSSPFSRNAENSRRSRSSSRSRGPSSLRLDHSGQLSTSEHRSERKSRTVSLFGSSNHERNIKENGKAIESFSGHSSERNLRSRAASLFGSSSHEKSNKGHGKAKESIKFPGLLKRADMTRKESSRSIADEVGNDDASFASENDAVHRRTTRDRRNSITKANVLVSPLRHPTSPGEASFSRRPEIIGLPLSLEPSSPSPHRIIPSI